MPHRESATKNSWKTTPMPVEWHVKVDFRHSYSLEDYELIKLGYIPQAMEEHWFFYWENNVLYCHSSWSGACHWEVRFVRRDDRYHAVETYANRDPGLSPKQEIKKDLERLASIIYEWCILG